MKVFISWSGETSQSVAVALRDWLPSVMQYIRPYVSSEDIEKGTRWGTEIAKELSESSYGILCTTFENQDAPWVNFEAGALSTAMDKAYVSPFLLNMKVTDLKRGPLTQFHATLYDKADVLKLVESINGRSLANEQLDVTILKKSFEMWWPKLDTDLQASLKSAKMGASPVKVPSRQEAMLEELLELSRSQQRALARPEDLLPPDYIAYAFRRAQDKSRTGLDDSSSKLHRAILELQSEIEVLNKDPEYKKIIDAVANVHRFYHRAEGRGEIRTRSVKRLEASKALNRSSTPLREGYPLVP